MQVQIGMHIGEDAADAIGLICHRLDAVSNALNGIVSAGKDYVSTDQCERVETWLAMLFEYVDALARWFPKDDDEQALCALSVQAAGVADDVRQAFCHVKPELEFVDCCALNHVLVTKVTLLIDEIQAYLGESERWMRERYPRASQEAAQGLQTDSLPVALVAAPHSL